MIVAAGLVAFCGASLTVANERQRSDPIKVNLAAQEHAKNLIQQGHVIVDKRNAWSEHQPSAEEENEFIRQHGIVPLFSLRKAGLGNIAILTLKTQRFSYSK